MGLNSDDLLLQMGLAINKVFCTWVLLVMTFFYKWVLLPFFFYSTDLLLHMSPAIAFSYTWDSSFYLAFFTHGPFLFIRPSLIHGSWGPCLYLLCVYVPPCVCLLRVYVPFVHMFLCVYVPFVCMSPPCVCLLRVYFPPCICC